MAQVTLQWQPILGSKLATSDYSLLFVVLAFRNGWQYRHSDFKNFICNELATLFVNMVNFGPVTREFKVKGVHPVVSCFKINLSDKLSQELLDRFSHSFHHMGRYLIVGCRPDPLFPIAQGTLPWQPILGLKWANWPIHLHSSPWHS